MEKHVRKIVKNGGGTYYISLPKEVMRELRFRERQKVTVRVSGAKVVIEDWKER
jgi:antitoxin component of MazEF toxin-antitoxin module